MFYNYIRKRLENGEVKIGIPALNSKDQKIYIEGKGIVNIIKFFLSKNEKIDLMRLLK